MANSTIDLKVADGIAEATLCRPEKFNSMNRAFWGEIRDLFIELDRRTDVRVAIIASSGRHFTAGLDLEDFAGLMQGTFATGSDPGRRGEELRRRVLAMQESFSVIERCRVPVIAAVQGGCIGGGIDMITCCDMRYASADAFFVVKEIDIGIVADLGTLQRLPKVIAPGIARELAYTARKIDAKRAREIGLVNEVFADHTALLAGARQAAREIAARSPLAIAGVKEMLNHARDHSVAEGLNYIATWQAGMLLSADLMEAASAQRAKREAKFAPLEKSVEIG